MDKLKKSPDNVSVVSIRQLLGPSCDVRTQVALCSTTCHNEPALKGLLRNCKSKARSIVVLGWKTRFWEMAAKKQEMQKRLLCVVMPTTNN